MIAVDKKIYKNKKRNIIIIIVILIILFILYGISIKSTPESREKKIISYLEKNIILNLKLYNWLRVEKMYYLVV